MHERYGLYGFFWEICPSIIFINLSQPSYPVYTKRLFKHFFQCWYSFLTLGRRCFDLRWRNNVMSRLGRLRGGFWEAPCVNDASLCTTVFSKSTGNFGSLISFALLTKCTKSSKIANKTWSSSNVTLIHELQEKSTSVVFGKTYISDKKYKYELTRRFSSDDLTIATKPKYSAHPLVKPSILWVIVCVLRLKYRFCSST